MIKIKVRLASIVKPYNWKLFNLDAPFWGRFFVLDTTIAPPCASI